MIKTPNSVIIMLLLHLACNNKNSEENNAVFIVICHVKPATGLTEDLLSLKLRQIVIKACREGEAEAKARS